MTLTKVQFDIDIIRAGIQEILCSIDIIQKWIKQQDQQGDPDKDEVAKLRGELRSKDDECLKHWEELQTCEADCASLMSRSDHLVQELQLYKEQLAEKQEEIDEQEVLLSDCQERLFSVVDSMCDKKQKKDKKKRRK